MSDSSKIRLFIVDDHQMFLTGIRAMFASHDQIEVVGECNDGAKVIDKLKSVHTDVILLDINLPGCDGMELNVMIKDLHHASRSQFYPKHDQRRSDGLRVEK